MKQTSFIICITFLLVQGFCLSHAEDPLPLTLEDIFNKANSIRFLSYETQITSPANTVRKFRIWIHDDNVYASGFLGGLKQIGEKSYLLHNDKWIEDPGLTIITVIVFLKYAQKADDTRIIGQELLGGEPVTVIEYTQPHQHWGSEIKIKLWISHKTYIPLKIREHNITQRKIQTEKITNISFKENDYQAFFREIEKEKERRRRAKEKPKPWYPEKEQKYSKMIHMDEQKDLSAKQKINAWEEFRKSISENDPSTRRDEQMRFKANTQIYYWQYVSRFRFSSNGIITDTQTDLEWIVGPDRDTNWNEARSWVAGLMIAGGRWRLPTINELKNLRDKRGYKRFHPPFFPKTGWRLWSGEFRKKKIGSWYFNYTMDEKESMNNSISINLRVVAVRDTKE
jgi:hypothetical protein